MYITIDADSVALPHWINSFGVFSQQNCFMRVVHRIRVLIPHQAWSEWVDGLQSGRVGASKRPQLFPRTPTPNSDPLICPHASLGYYSLSIRQFASAFIISDAVTSVAALCWCHYASNCLYPLFNLKVSLSLFLFVHFYHTKTIQEFYF